MYTEENEFDYNDYTNENSTGSQKKSFFNKGFLIKVAIIILCLIALIFVVFKLRNGNQTKKENDPSNNLVVFNNNVGIVKSAAEKYFFENGNIPKEVGESTIININDLKNENLVKEIRDYNGEVCGYNTSLVTLTRNKSDYMLTIKLACPSMENSVTYYYDLEYNCLTCNGESYTPSNENDNNDNDNNNNSNDNNNNNQAVCGNFSDWTTEYIADDKLERETRTLVKGYKENISYGDWSSPTTIQITPSDTLEVKSEVREETISNTTDWSKESTTKPSEKEGREISTRTSKKSYTTESCTGGELYTVDRKTWDNTAIRCTSTGIGKVTCTYRSEKVCKNVTKYKTVTYYKYRDTTTTKVNTTYYQSRTIIRNAPTYTDYILESEMPAGYQKVVGSERIEYRYREKCGK